VAPRFARYGSSGILKRKHQTEPEVLVFQDPTRSMTPAVGRRATVQPTGSSDNPDLSAYLCSPAASAWPDSGR